MKALLKELLSSQKGTYSSTRAVFITITIVVVITLLTLNTYIIINATNGNPIDWEGMSLFALTAVSFLVTTGVVKYKQKNYEKD